MITNPYKNIGSAIRQNATTHEHICSNTIGHEWHQQRLENLINRGNDIVCGVNYQPAVPTYPLSGFTHKYKAFKSWDDLTIVEKEFSAYYEDFVKADGQLCKINDVVQLPNAEHAWFKLPTGKVNGGLHINLVGSMYGEPASEIPSGWENAPSGSNLGQWRIDHPLYTLKELLQLSKDSALFGNLFGTLNHPGYTNLSIEDALMVMKVADEVGDCIHAVEVYNNGDSISQHEHNEYIYDALLSAGYKLNCVCVVDWPDSFAANPYNKEGDNKGTNCLLLPSNYNSLSYANKQLAAIEAFRNGSYYGTGKSSFALIDANVSGNIITLEFDQKCDEIIFVTDGIKNSIANVQKVSVALDADCKYARFVAKRGTDFIYTNPFYNDSNQIPMSRKMAILMDW